MANAIEIIKWCSDIHTKIIERITESKFKEPIEKVSKLIINKPKGFDLRQACRARLYSRKTVGAAKPILNKPVNKGHLKTTTKVNKILYLKP